MRFILSVTKSMADAKVCTLKIEELRFLNHELIAFVQYKINECRVKLRDNTALLKIRD